MIEQFFAKIEGGRGLVALLTTDSDVANRVIPWLRVPGLLDCEVADCRTSQKVCSEEESVI